MKVPKTDIYTFLILFPFLYPIGLDAINPIKIVMIIWQMIVSLYLLLYLFSHSKAKIALLFKDSYVSSILIYHVWLLVTTLALQHGINAGLKKIFIAPFACIACGVLIRRNCKSFFRVALIILLIEEVLNFAFWNVKIFSGDQFLLGIRTDFPVYTLIAILVSKICLEKHIFKTKILPYVTIVLSVLSLVFAKVSTGLVSIAIIAILSYLIRFKRVEHIFEVVSNKKLITISLLINVGIIVFGLQKYFDLLLNTILGEGLLLNGRTIIWDAAIPLVKQSPWIGYGVYGVDIELPSWWGGTLNYAHNQLLQLMLDGGIVAAVLFIICIVVVATRIDHVSDYHFRKMATVFLFVILITFIPECYPNYTCFYVLLSILADLQIVEKIKEKRGKLNVEY